MTKPRDIIYKCRLCGTKFAAASTPDGRHALMPTLLGNDRFPFPGKTIHRIDDLETHECEDGKIGLADIAGLGPEAP